MKLSQAKCLIGTEKNVNYVCIVDYKNTDTVNVTKIYSIPCLLYVSFVCIDVFIVDLQICF